MKGWLRHLKALSCFLLGKSFEVFNSESFELIDVEHNLCNCSDGNSAGLVIAYIGFCADKPALMWTWHVMNIYSKPT
jgi:hypothetical protein